MRRVQFFVLLFGLGVVAGSTSTGAAGQARPAVTSLLDRYAAHDFDAPLPLVNVDNKGATAVVAELERTGTAWTTARGPQQTPGRRLVAATFALDLAHLWAARPIRWHESQQVLVWGCAQLRQNNTPPDAERWWHLAAIGLFESRQDVTALAGADVQSTRKTPAPEGGHGHLAHALARFPDEPRLKLAQAVATEMASWGNGPAVDIGTPTRSNALQAVLSRYESLFGQEPVAAEAHLRYGYSALRLDDARRGVDHLAQADASSTDTVLRYLSRFYAGYALERLGDSAAAAAEYRRALDLAPGAHTAGLALVSVLMRASRVPEAQDVAARLLTSSDAVDPVARYRTGDYRFVPQFLDQLRRMLP